MRDRLEAATHDPERLRATLDTLETDSVLLETAALDVL
jgi:hypothetical protein